MSESELLTAILDLARVWHWRSFHVRQGRTARGWTTPIQGNGDGFPDCLFLRHERLVVAELKSDVGKVTDAQANWLSAFREAGAETYVWRPADWHTGHVLATLERVGGTTWRTSTAGPARTALVVTMVSVLTLAVVSL